MPKGKTKKFIDKKNSVTFHLVHRSQQDPLIADESAPQRVLVPVGDIQNKKYESKILNKDDRIKEQHKFGIYFDDDYDYLKHLKDVRTLTTEWEKVETKKENENKEIKPDKANINLPSSVFESDIKEKVGLLNKAAPISGPQLHLDPEIIAALDEDFDFDDPDNVLEDNFIELANQPAGSGEELNDFDSDDLYDEDDEDFADEENDEVYSLNSPQHTFRQEETKSRFTEYSISSSVMRRNQQLTLLDDKFEHMYNGYDDNEIGALDCEDIEGNVAPDSDVVMQHLSEFEKQQKVEDDLNKPSKDILNRYVSDSENEDDINLEKLVIEDKPDNNWDCESILSKYSNKYNHPKLISDRKDHLQIKIDSKTGIPTNVINGKDNKLTFKNLVSMEKSQNGVSDELISIKTSNSQLHLRSKNETPEEKKQRKQALKEYKRERRQERKINILAFKDEKKRQEKILMNQKNNTHGDLIL